jgi:Arc/MetJ-type ribon-helix-helix transcriptional regulator
MNKKVPITVTLDPRLREWAEHLVATGKAPSISAVINDALTQSYTQHKRGLALLRERAGHADEDRVARMRAHIDAQAAALGLSGRGKPGPFGNVLINWGGMRVLGRRDGPLGMKVLCMCRRARRRPGRITGPSRSECEATRRR